MHRIHRAAFILFVACAPRSETPSAPDYLYLWTRSADSTKPDFLAVLDVTEDSGRYGRLLTTVPVPGLGNVPHHTEHEMPADRRLFVNGFGSGRTFIYDMTDPAAPRLDGQFGDVAGMMHPHSYLRLPNGNVLATFQMQHDSLGVAPGGLAEITPRGDVVRTRSANVPGVDRAIRPYSAGIVAPLDRLVTTTTDMDADSATHAVQIWRLSDLALLHTINLPDGPAGDEGAATAEPRVMEDGRTVLVSTFNCGLYLMEGLDTDAPSARLVASFPRKEGADCAIPVIAGHYYLVTVPSLNAVVSLDISDPTAPHEVSRAVLGAEDVPHWIAISPDHRRVVVTGYGAMEHRVLILTFDPTSGQLAIDPRFRAEGDSTAGFRMDGTPHGAVFGRKDGTTD